MRVLICPDKFAGSISATAAAAALAEGWRAAAAEVGRAAAAEVGRAAAAEVGRAAAAEDELTCRPLADGGPGFLDVLSVALDGRRVPVRTTDPLGRPAAGEVLVAGGTAYVESAHACGLHLLSAAERDPTATTSYGLGVLLAVAAETGAGEIVVGLGGSAVNDAGAGMLAALGAAPLDVAGYALPYGGAALAAVASLGGQPALRQARLVAATDVDNPLWGPHGASRVFGPQKGAREQDLPLLDAALARFAQVLERELPTCPPGLDSLPGGGAAGGLGAALLALGGRVTSGIGLVRELTGLDAAIAGADLVITGEGSFDAQSLRGKVVAGVAAAARERGVPCVVVAGRVAAAPQEAAEAGVTECHSLVEHFGSEREAMERPAEGLRALGTHLARHWSRRPPRRLGAAGRDGYGNRGGSVSVEGGDTIGFREQQP